MLAGSWSIIPSEIPVVLRTKERKPLFLKFEQRGEVIPDVRFAGEFKVSTQAYYYGLRMGTEEDSQELLAWHWERGKAPHLHSADPLGQGRRLHIPAGGSRITIERVLQHLIEEWEVEPGRADWGPTLANTQARFDKWQTQDSKSN